MTATQPDLWDSDPVPLPDLDRASRFVGTRHPDTSKEMERRMNVECRPGLRRQIVRRLSSCAETDDELERGLGRSHQSVSAARNGLVADGWVESAGQVRDTRWGNPATVWRLTDRGRAAWDAETAWWTA